MASLHGGVHRVKGDSVEINSFQHNGVDQYAVHLCDGLKLFFEGLDDLLFFMKELRNYCEDQLCQYREEREESDNNCLPHAGG